MMDTLPVVLVHGLRMNGAMWSPVVARLRQDRAVVAPDLPGHAGRAGEAFTVDAAATLLRETVDSVGGRALLVGHSLGGAIAMRTAALHPEAVAGLVAIGATFPRGGGPTRPAYRAMTWLVTTRPAFSERLTSAVLRRMLPESVWRPTLAAGLASASVPEVMGEMATFDTVAQLSRYAGPVWLVNGALDQFRMGERACLAACSDGRLIVWPGVNHVTELAGTGRLVTLIEDACAVAASR